MNTKIRKIISTRKIVGLQYRDESEMGYKGGGGGAHYDQWS